MKEEIHIVETIDAVGGQVELLKQELLKMVPLSRGQPGCLYYHLFQDKETPYRFAIYMGFEDYRSYEKHVNADYIAEFVEKFDNTLYQDVVETFYVRLSEPQLK